jgi:hypothetical protein
MSDFKPDIKLPTAIEIDKLIRRFGDPHETQHSMGERFAIADALKATTERIAKLEAALRYIQIDSDEIIIVAAQTISKYAREAQASEGET